MCQGATDGRQTSPLHASSTKHDGFRTGVDWRTQIQQHMQHGSNSVLSSNRKPACAAQHSTQALATQEF